MGSKPKFSLSAHGREAVNALLRLTSHTVGRPVEFSSRQALVRKLVETGQGLWLPEDDGRAFTAVSRVLFEGRVAGGLCAGPFAATDDQTLASLADAALSLGRMLEPASPVLPAGHDPIPAQLRYWVENAPVAIAVHDREMRYLLVNERWRFDFAGYRAEDVVGCSLYDLEPDTRAFTSYYENCMAGERLVAPRIPVTLADGGTVFLNMTAIPWKTDTGEVGGLLAMYRNLDEAGGDSFEMLRTQERLETAIRLGGFAVWEMDYESKSMWARGSDQWFSSIGELEGSAGFLDVMKDPFGTVLPEDRPKCFEEAQRAVAEQRPFRAEYRLNRRDKEIWISGAMEAQKGPDGERRTLLGVMTDITERKAAERELEKALAAAEAANHAKSEFLANMSHEIRTPMNGVIGMNGLLLKTALTPEQRKYAEAVRVSADSLMHILNDILEVSKLEAGKVELESVDFSLLNLVEDSVELLAVRAQEKGLDMAAYVDEGARGLFKGDPTRLRQVLLNLLSNAIKFTEMGHVVVDVRSRPAAAGRTGLRVEVRDTGIGLADDAKSKLFRKFQQADGSITRKYGGTGLGLSISRQLVELMGGAIGVEDARGGGSVFWIDIELPSGASQPKVCRSDLIGARILVVDDVELNRTIFRRQLEDCGAVVSEADSGTACLGAIGDAAARGEPFQLVLLDQMMPVMSGDETARLIRAGERPQPAIVMASSMGEPLTSKVAAEIGLDAFLTKPVRHQALVTVLCEALGAAPAEPVQEPQEDAAISDGGARILLAEDNEINTLLARTILEQLGFSVRCVVNGVEAVEAASAETFDLILMDVQMPQMDGLEATRRIRALGSPAAAVPIVAMTANAMRSDREACLAAGMDDFIAKPIDTEVFLGVLERIVNPDEAEAGRDAA